jgi:hypothetical protein
VRRFVLVLAVGCGGGPQRPFDATAAPVAPVAGKPGPVARPGPAPVAAEPAPTESASVDGPTSTPGRHPRIPRGPSTSDLDRIAIRRILRQRMAPIFGCYERLSPADRRRVVVRFTIGPTGTVLSSSAGGPQGELENCIAAAFAGITFEKPENGGTLTVTYPLHFRPG